jgi:hypothetical protein
VLTRALLASAVTTTAASGRPVSAKAANSAREEFTITFEDDDNLFGLPAKPKAQPAQDSKRRISTQTS